MGSGFVRSIVVPEWCPLSNRGPRQKTHSCPEISGDPYYFQSARGNRLFELGLGEVTLAFAGVSQAEDLKRLEAVVARANREGFAAVWLQEQQLDWAADLIRAEQDRRVEYQTASTEALA